MTISRVQGNFRGTSTGSTISVTLGSAPAQGNRLVAAIATRGTSIITVTSISQTGVSWSKQKDQTYPSVYQNTEIWLGEVSAGASPSITINLSGSASAGAIADVCEYSGLFASGYLDQTAGATGASASSVTGETPETTKPYELWIGAVGAWTGNASALQTEPKNTFTLLDGTNFEYNPGYFCSLAYLEKIVSAIGKASSGTTIANTAGWCACIITLKGAYTKTIAGILGI